ncbi:uncharacterized protein B0H64DRAFT_12398 [Chaetomium fimeti]|jgi:hypothetical protein|uniref:Uncharacterized protein n=1 Tax=Chaetomium fimeti TaxID=1854472 RepID=A0AAE0LWT3_9PEZI|nr:hypothetical protein B0H64DRAFT_12398 [Chaetomium fimeti]
MANFPKLIPAFTIQVVIQTPTPVSPSLVFVPLASTGGSIVSEPSYPIQLRAAIEHGGDFIRVSADGTQARLDVQSLARDAVTGALVRFTYRGKVDTTGAMGRVLRGEEGAGTTGFGDAVSVVEFETGGGELAVLENKVYVGTGRFIIEAGKPTIVEYLVSEVVA